MIFDDIELTEGQAEGVDKIKRFLTSPERYFRLTGRAGTGKTTLIKYALKELVQEDSGTLKKTKRDILFTPNVLGIALAHKAKNNLQDSIPFVNTFASAYGHREKIYPDGRRRFIPDLKKLMYADCKKPIRIFVIDEVGMWSEKMAQLTMKETNMYSKIILMGDRGQLPPIRDDNQGKDDDSDSPMFDLRLPDWCDHELTERVRQTEGNSIIDLSDAVYEQIFGDRDISVFEEFINNPVVDEEGRGYSRCNYAELYQLFMDSSENYLDTKVIAYRNKTVNVVNTHLRNYIHDYPKEIFIPKEIIYMNKTYYGKDTDENNFAFYNSSEYIIEDVTYGSVEGIGVIHAFLEKDKSMPVVNGNRYSNNMRMFNDRVDQYVDAKDWLGKYGFTDRFGDFNYGYALTCYKAQGSTYKTVFVDMQDILSLGVLSNKRKLQTLYTAITRASHKVWFVH